MKIRHVVLIAGVVTFASPAWAAPQSAETLKSAEQVVRLLDMERAMDNMFNDMKGLFAENVIAALERDAAQSDYLRHLFTDGRGGRERFVQILGDEFVKSLQTHYGDMRKAAAEAYAQQFTDKELKELITFFSSGVGQKWRDKSPQIEAVMGQWGERAGMQAGSVALGAALQRAEVEMLGKGTGQ